MVFRLLGLVLGSALETTKFKHVTGHMSGIDKVVLLSPDQFALALRNFPFLLSYLYPESEFRKLRPLPLSEAEYEDSLQHWEIQFRKWFETARLLRATGKNRR